MSERTPDNRTPVKECPLRTHPVCPGKLDSVDSRKKAVLTFLANNNLNVCVV